VGHNYILVLHCMGCADGFWDDHCATLQAAGICDLVVRRNPFTDGRCM
jgi:hypothetical protein